MASGTIKAVASKADVDALNSKIGTFAPVYDWGKISGIASKIASESANHKNEANWSARFYFNASNPPSDLPVNELKWRYATGVFYARNTNGSGETDGYVELDAYGIAEKAECNVVANVLGTWSLLKDKLTPVYRKQQSITFSNGIANVTFSSGVYLLAINAVGSGATSDTYCIAGWSRTSGQTKYCIFLKTNVSTSMNCDFIFTTDALSTDITIT